MKFAPVVFPPIKSPPSVKLLFNVTDAESFTVILFTKTAEEITGKRVTFGINTELLIVGTPTGFQLPATCHELEIAPVQLITQLFVKSALLSSQSDPSVVVL